MKSSIDPEEFLAGQPYGGIGFVANRVKNITYKPLMIDCDRITGVQLMCRGETLLNIFGVYMPFYNVKLSQINLYKETLDILQAAMDKITGPVMIVGDMNTSLPKHNTLPIYWYRLSPFTVHSYMLSQSL